MIDRTAFNHHIAILAEMHRYAISAPTIDEYYRLLSEHLTTAQFVIACDALALDRNGFWPKPGAFLAAAGVAPNTRAALQAEGARLFAALKRWMDAIGGPTRATAEQCAELSPATWKAISAVGGLAGIHSVTPERVAKMERDFGAYYAEAVERARAPELVRTTEAARLPGEHHAPLPKLLKAS